MRKLFVLAAVVVALTMGLADEETAHGEGVPVDLNPWTPESYPAVSGFGAGVWTVAADGLSVFQSVNGQPTLFCSDFPAFDTKMEGKVLVAEAAGDDDYIGFALGFQPGDTSNANADYLLTDWKRNDQFFDFGSPSSTPGSTAKRGLAVSRVVGIPTADEFWGHLNFDHSSSDLNNGLQELQRGSTLGSTGWVPGQEYVFTFQFSANSLKVSVDSVPQIDITGSFNNGRLCFYNFSQTDVTYSGFGTTRLVQIDIKPGSDPNCFNNDDHGVIPVAILGSATFDVTQIDPGTVSLDALVVKAVGKVNKLLTHIEDVNNDGFDDLVVQIQDIDGAFSSGSGTATVAGALLDGTPFEGSDSICVVP